MNYYLRFTDTAQEDLERGTSILEIPSTRDLDIEDKILDGLCGYSIGGEFEFQTDEDLLKVVKMYRANVHYSGKAVVFAGEYVNQNPNGEGVIFKAQYIVKEFDI